MKFEAGMPSDTWGDDAVGRAKRSVLDLFACAARGMGAGAVEPARRYVLKHAPGDEATIYFGGGRAGAREAALMNGAYVHSTEMSEPFTRALAPPGNSVLPALPSPAARDHRSGRALTLGTATAPHLPLPPAPAPP